MDTTGKCMDEQEIRKLEARVVNLESQVAFLLRINGLSLSALRTASDDELLKHYRDAVQLIGLREQQLSPDVCLCWSELFCQLSEFELIRLQGLVDYAHTWEPFYHLCIRMMRVVRHARGFARNGELKHLYAFLEKGRKNLRDAGVIMIQKYPQGVPKMAHVLLKDDPLSID
jgi:hypothetical protein